MKVIPPITVNAAMLTSSTVVEPVAPAAAWVSGTAYGAGTIVSVASPAFQEYVRVVTTYTLWVSGTTYIIGDIRNAPSNGLPYKRITAGAGTTDPALDSTNWTSLATISPDLNPDQWSSLGAYERVWISGTTYAIGDQVIRTSTHRKYQRGTAGAGTTVPELDTANWVDIGPTNKWAMFDLLRNTASTKTGAPIVVVIVPGQRIDSLGVVGLQASSVTVSMDIGVTNYYSRTITTIERNTVNWSGYFFNTFHYSQSTVLFDLPLITGATLTVTIDNGAGTAKCGGLVIGRSVYLGGTQYSPVRSALNFSTTTRDNFGNVTLVQRRSVPKTDQKIFTKKASVNSILQLMSDLNASPALWSGLDDQTTSDYFDALLILGFYKEMSIDVQHADYALLSLQLEEI